jgi:hypothetical protein
MQHEAAPGIDRTAAQHLQGLGIFGQLDLLILVDDVELHQQFGEIDAADRAIDHDPHGALGECAEVTTERSKRGSPSRAAISNCQ